ncbi:MAG TPA: tyrosine-type recombinase/integrase [Aestuariivirgaceae bacterium]|nr:tyrosine-type recombinase/integrase [Aestuariivirgaceae bacterium]
MPRRKPQGWPAYMVAKRLRGGVTGYYWAPPTWALKKDCPLTREALDTDYAEAKRRCDEVLNPQLQGWMKRGDVGERSPRLEPGTFDWMVATFKRSPKYAGLPPKTRRSYDAALALIGNHIVKDSRRVGSFSLKAITGAVVDKLYVKLLTRDDGTERRRTVNLAMAVARRAWNVARRASADRVPLENPFERMGLKYRPKQTQPVTREELMRLVAAADAAAAPSIGTACMISFYWLLRQSDCLKLAWGSYRPADTPGVARLVHHKTGQPVEVPLFDDDGTTLFPELCDRLDASRRLGSVIVMRDQPDRFRKVHLPWKLDHFRHAFAEIREAAGLEDSVTFMGLRHGGLTEGADVGLSDAQMRALSGHQTAAALLRYSQATSRQRKVGARLRRDGTKQGNLSE